GRRRAGQVGQAGVAGAAGDAGGAGDQGHAAVAERPGLGGGPQAALPLVERRGERGEAPPQGRFHAGGEHGDGLRGGAELLHLFPDRPLLRAPLRPAGYQLTRSAASPTPTRAQNCSKVGVKRGSLACRCSPSVMSFSSSSRTMPASSSTASNGARSWA